MGKLAVISDETAVAGVATLTDDCSNKSAATFAKATAFSALVLVACAACSTGSTGEPGTEADGAGSAVATPADSGPADSGAASTDAARGQESSSDPDATQPTGDGDAGDGATDDPGVGSTPPPPPRYSFNPGPIEFIPAEGLSIDLELVGSGFVEPVDMANPNYDKESIDILWIVEQEGTVRRLVDGRPGDPPVLDVRDRVEDGANEQGLLGIALHPGYFRNGRVFVNYTDHDDATVISEFFVPQDQDRLSPRIDPSTEQLILRIPQPARNHNGGQIKFGSDGYLYIGMGDGGGANDTYGNAQNPESLLGKMLRIDVDAAGQEPYGIPADNPFLNSTSFRPEIWAWGLRNPWRFSFLKGRGNMEGLYIGDVGQGSWEEIDWVPLDGGGANFGWPILEGSHCFMAPEGTCDTDGATLRPIVDYPQGGGNGCSVTGGVVVQTSGSPLEGAYIFADYCSGRMWIAWRDDGGVWSSRVVADTGLTISAFGTDGSGEVYVLAHGSGEVYRIVASIDG